MHQGNPDARRATNLLYLRRHPVGWVGLFSPLNAWPAGGILETPKALRIKPLLARSIMTLDTIFTVKNEHLGRLNPDEAVRFIAELLWADARRVGLSVTSINISSRTNVPDGGVDPAQDRLARSRPRPRNRVFFANDWL